MCTFISHFLDAVVKFKVNGHITYVQYVLLVNSNGRDINAITYTRKKKLRQFSEESRRKFVNFVHDREATFSQYDRAKCCDTTPIIRYDISWIDRRLWSMPAVPRSEKSWFGEKIDDFQRADEIIR